MFAPEQWSKQALPTRPAERYGSLVKSIRTRLEKILGQDDAAIPLPAGPFRIVPEKELVRLDDWLTALWSQHSEWIEGLRHLEEEEKTVDRLMMTLVALLDLQIDLQRFHQPQRFMDLRIGTVPSGNIRRLDEALGLAGYTLSRFLESEDTVHLIVAGPIDREADIVDVLQAAG